MPMRDFTWWWRPRISCRDLMDSQAELIRQQTHELNREVKRHRIRLLVLPGMEIALDPSLPQLLSGNRLLALAVPIF